MELVEIPGNKKGSKIYSFGNWEYYENSMKKNRQFDCIKKTTKFKCTARLIKNDDGTIVVNEELHNHPSSKRQKLNDLKSELRRRATDPVRTSTVVKNVLKNFNGQFITTSAARKIVEKVVKNYQTENPSNLLELDELLKTNPLYRDFYIGRECTADKKEIAIFLGSSTMLRHLDEANSIIIEMTSRCLPSTPTAALLLTIHVKKLKQGVTAMYIICSSRSEKLNNAIFNFLQQKCENVKANLQNVICDYDLYMIASLREKFPTVHINGSWIHYMKLLNRKWLTLELPESYNSEIFALSCLLKIIPMEKVDEAITIIEIKCGAAAYENENYILYSRFIRECKPFIVSKLFIEKQQEDAINPVEMFNVNLLNDLGCKKDLHEFLKLIKFHIKKSESQWENEKFLKKNNASVKINFELSQQQKKLIKKTINLQQFLDEFLRTNLMDHIRIQLSWPHYSNDTGKFIGVPNLKDYVEKLPPRIEENELQHPCQYCLSVEAAIKIKTCSHLIGCYLCWLNDYYAYSSRSCPMCRVEYTSDQIEIFL